MSAIEAAKKFVNEHFPDCTAALLVGSAARGELRPTSDLDIIVITEQIDKPYRKAYQEHGWPIEVFVGNKQYNESKIRQPKDCIRPSSLTSLAEGIVLKDQMILLNLFRKEHSKFYNRVRRLLLQLKLTYTDLLSQIGWRNLLARNLMMKRSLLLMI